MRICVVKQAGSLKTPSHHKRCIFLWEFGGRVVENKEDLGVKVVE